MNIDLKNQSILQKIFFENKRNCKLEKNRTEKQKVKERRAETFQPLGKVEPKLITPFAPLFLKVEGKVEPNFRINFWLYLF